MRFVAIGAAAAALFLAGNEAQAARWCAGSGECGFRSQAQCARTTGAGCHRQMAARVRAPEPAAARPRGGYPEFPSRPAWASPWECYMDEGYGRYTRCNSSSPAP